MKTIITTLSVLVAAVLVACSGSDPVSPDTQTASVRFYNGNLTAAAMRIGDTKIFDAMAAANVSSRVDIAAATDSIEFRAVDGATNAILARRKAIVKPRPYSFVLFPATSVFNCVRMPEMCVVHEDAAPPTSGRARIRVINATTDGTEFSLNIDGMQLLGNDKLLVRSISNTVDIEAGEHDITLIRTTN